jgi:RNA polymerase sigma factor (sigma-70 family)
MVQQKEEAEDLAQEVFIKLFRQAPRFRGDCALSTWIYRVAVTTALDALRSRKRRAALLSFWRQDETGVHFDHPGILPEKKEAAAILFKAVQKLPEKQAAAFLLQKTEGLSQSEIAAALEITPSAAESLLHRAKENLKKILGQYYKTDML